MTCLSLALMVALTALPLWSGAAAVYRCEGERGAVSFSQYPCASGARPQPLTPPRVVEMPGLNEAERQQLDALDRTLDRQRKALQKRRAQQAARRQRAAADARKRCDRAQRQLEQLARLRRQGYSLNAAARLDAREADLDEEVRAHC